MKIYKDPGFYFFVFFAVIFIYILNNNIQREKRSDKQLLSPNYDILSDAVDEIYGYPDIRRYKTGKIPEWTASALLYHAMQSNDKVKKIKAALACASAPDIYSTPYLIQLLRDTDSEVNETGQKALKKIWNLELSADEWQKFWMNKRKNATLFGRIIGLIWIILSLAMAITGLVKRRLYLIIGGIIFSFWGYTCSFTDWFITKVVYISDNAIYYKGTWYNVTLCSYQDFLIARIMQYVWIVIGISLLCFGIWYTIKHPAAVKRLLKIK